MGCFTLIATIPSIATWIICNDSTFCVFLPTGFIYEVSEHISIFPWLPLLSWFCARGYVGIKVQGSKFSGLGFTRAAGRRSSQFNPQISLITRIIFITLRAMRNLQGLIPRRRKGRREKINENISHRPTQTHTDGWAERGKIHRRRKGHRENFNTVILI